MAQQNLVENESNSKVLETSQHNHHARTPITRILEKLSFLELPEKEHFENYLRYKWRSNHKQRTIDSSFTSIVLFLDFYKTTGKTELRRIERSDLEAFIEHEQDRGIRISTVRTRLACIIAFLHFLLEQDLLGHTHITTTQRYCRVSNLKVQRDYYTAMEVVMERGQAGGRSE